jgi:hypothetical protein
MKSRSSEQPSRGFAKSCAVDNPSSQADNGRLSLTVPLCPCPAPLQLHWNAKFCIDSFLLHEQRQQIIKAALKDIASTSEAQRSHESSHKSTPKTFQAYSPTQEHDSLSPA